MKIESLHIDGFGVWNDKTWAPLGPGLNVFHGANETGKSTLMAFIRSILFGLDRRGQARRYEPLNGGTHGGWLDVTVAGRTVRIERKAGKHVRGTVTIYDGDTAGGDKELETVARRYDAYALSQRVRFRAGGASAVPYASGHGNLAAHYPARHWASARRGGLRSKGISKHGSGRCSFRTARMASSTSR